MSSKGKKRKRCSQIKKKIVNHMHKLNIDVADFNDDVRIANEEFGLMFKSMVDKQQQLLSRSFLIAEKFGQITTAMKEGKVVTLGESSNANPDLPKVYAKDARRFLHDSSSSLHGGATLLKEHTKEMDEIFKEYIEKWETQINDFKELAERIDGETTKLCGQMLDFVRNISSYRDS